MKQLNLLFFAMLFGLLFAECTPKTTKKITSAPEVVPELSTPHAPDPPSAPVSSGAVLPDLPIHDALIQGELANGMKYYILKNGKPENRAELRLAVNAGAMQEDENQLGLAHFVEHMAFNGSKNFKKNELVDYLESIGTRFGPDLNAYTSFDETVYMLQVRTDIDSLYKKGLLILEDWAGSISFDDEEIDKERGVVQSEWRSRLSPDQRMQQKTFPKLYSGSRYAERLPIGKTDIIMNADYALFKKFYADWYRPELMSVIVVGDVDVADTEAYIKANFSKIKAKTEARKKESSVVPDHKETIVTIATDKEAPFTRAQLMYKHDRIDMKNVMDYKESLTHSLYNAMINARLTEITKSANPPYIFAYSGYGNDVGRLATYDSYITLAEDKIVEGMKRVVMENERVLRHGFTQSELDRKKTELMERYKRAELESDKNDSRRYASQLVYHFLDDNPFMSEAQRLQLTKDFMSQIFLTDINKLAKKWITDENRVAVITAPEKEGVVIPTESEVLAIFDEVKKKDIEPYVDKVITRPLFNRRLAAGTIKSKETTENNKIVRYELSNGVKVNLKKTDFKNDEVLMTAYSKGGTALYSDADYFNASYASDIVRASGLSDFSSSDLEKLMTGKKASVYPFIGDYFEGMSGDFSPNDTEIFFQMLHLYFMEPRRDEEAFTSFLNKQKGFFQNILSNPDYYFMDYSSKVKTNNHMRVGFPTSESMDKINLERALQIYSERFSNAADFDFTFVGNMEEKQFEDMINLYLATLPATEQRDEFKDVGINYLKGGVEKTIQKGKAEKTQVEMFYHGDFAITPESMHKFNSMIQVLRIKMRESMREDKGGVYGVRVSGYVDKRKEEYRITIGFNCDPGREQELIETAINDIQNAKTNGVESKDLTKVKETQIQSMTKNLKENRYWNRQISDAVRYGSNPDEIGMKSLQKFVDELTSDDIKSAAGSYFGNNKIQLVMQPAAKPNN